MPLGPAKRTCGILGLSEDSWSSSKLLTADIMSSLYWIVVVVLAMFSSVFSSASMLIRISQVTFELVNRNLMLELVPEMKSFDITTGAEGFAEIVAGKSAGIPVSSLMGTILTDGLL